MLRSSISHGSSPLDRAITITPIRSESDYDSSRGVPHFGTSHAATQTNPISAASLEILNATQTDPISAARQVTFAQHLKELSNHTARMLMFSSWSPPIMFYMFAFFDLQIKIIILEFMEKLGPYSMAWMQLMSAAAAVVLAGITYCISKKLRCFSGNISPDLTHIPFDFLPVLRPISRGLNNIMPSPVLRFFRDASLPFPLAFSFMTVNFAIFGAAGIIHGNQLQSSGMSATLNPVELNLIRLSLEPPTAVAFSMACSVVAVFFLNALWMLAKAGYSRCHRSTPASVANNPNSILSEIRGNMTLRRDYDASLNDDERYPLTNSTTNTAY